MLLVLFVGMSSNAWGDTWNGTDIASGFSSGKGTDADPYIIDNAAQLVYFANNCSGKTWVVKLNSDISLGENYWVNGTTTKYGSGKEFKGKFIADKKSDGTNYTVSNFKLLVPNAAASYGLLSKVTNGRIENIDVNNVTIDFVANITTAAYVGALVGSTSTNTVVENCHASNVTMNLKGITANSGMGGLIGYFSDKTTVTNCSSKNFTMTSSATITVGGQGALIGSAAGKAHTISNCTVDNANITVNAEYKGGSLGGVIGYCQGGGATARASISGCTITNSTITASKLGAKAYVGLVVGQNSTYVDVADCSATGTDSKHSKITITGAAALTSGNDSYLGGVVGREQGNGSIAGCTAEYVDIEIGGACSYTRIGGITGTSHLGTSTKFSGIKNSTVSHVAISIGGAITGSNSYIGGVAGYVDSYNELTDINVNDASITVTGLCTNANIGGLVGYVKGGAVAKRTLVQGNTLTSTSISVGGANASTNYIGGLTGIATTHVNLFNNKIENPAIAIIGAINGNSYFGGAVGNLATYTTIDGLYVTGGSITGPSAAGTGVKNAAEFYVGGAVGRQQGSANSAATQQNQIRNVAVDGMNINLGNFVPATGIMSNNKFSVGGVIGQTSDVRSYKEECGIPENLISKDVKLYAPYAMTSPLVGGFGTPAYNTYTIDSNTYNDDVQRSRVGSWVYSGYKLGLSAQLLEKTNAHDAASANGKVKRNYSKTLVTEDGVQYLPVDDETFLKYNRMYDVEYTCKTVLWWTRTDNNASYANNDIDQTIYPQSGLATTGMLTDSKYPYTMYFYQGVNHGTSVTADQTTHLIAGISGSISHANDETPVTLTITDAQEKARGFDEHTIKVTASDETDISYQWYVDGVASGTGSSITVKPDWRFGKGIVVNASKGGSIVASANYTLKHGVLHTKNSIAATSPLGESEGADYVGMPTAQRGTSDNPYIIDCPEALRQFSWLSTLSNSFFWETVEKFGSDGKTSYQSALHYNRAYYELSNDIDLGVGADEATRRANPGDFTPISHAGTNAGPTQGTYHQNSIFSGHFDGKGYAIKNFKVTWRGDRSSGFNQYFGLFGVVGWGITSTTETCVIQNLVIDNAQLVHDPSNTSFFYNNGASGGNNVQLGILAGMVTARTSIQNVEVRNSKITDDGSSAYNMAGKWLAVGGMIGRVQYYYKENGDLSNSVNLQFLSADCDVTLTHAAFNGGPTPTLTRYFNVGGVVGSLCSTGAYATINMPQYAYYTGKVDAPLAMVGPVFATVDYNGNTAAEKQYYWQHYMAKTSNATQDVPNLYYGNYQIQTYNNSAKSDLKTITSAYPDVICSEGSRTVTAHNKTHPNDNSIYNDDKYFGEYQGVNYGEAAITSGEQGNIEILFEEAMVAEGIEGYYLIFDGNQMQLVKSKPMKVSILDNTTDAAATTHTLKVVNNKGDEGYTYVWYSNGEPVGTEATYDAPIGTTPQLIYVVATETATLTSMNTEAIGLPRSIKELTADYAPKKLSECENKTFDGVFTVTPAAAVIGADGYTMSYIWQEWTPDQQSTYTAEEVLAINQDYIQSVQKKSDSSTVSAPYTSDIYTNADQYTITYKQVEVAVTITAEEYAALSEIEKVKCTPNDDGSYTHTVQQPYTPVKVGDMKITPGSWGALTSSTSATASGTTSTTTNAFDSKTYKCTITATDGNWQKFLTDYASDTHFTVEQKQQYPTTFTYELFVKIRLSSVVFLHPTQSTENGVPAGKDEYTNAELGDGMIGDKSHPVKTWGKAYSLLDGSMGADWDDNIIVLVGTSTGNQTWGVNSDGTRNTQPKEVSEFGLSNLFATGEVRSEIDALPYDQYIAKIAASPMGKNVTITGKYDGVNYDAKIESPLIGYGSNKLFFNFYGNTKFEYLTFYGGAREYDIIFGHYHDLWFGEGLIMKNFQIDDSSYGTMSGLSSPRFQVFGGMHMDKRFNLIYDAKTGKLDEMLQKTVPNGEKGFTLTFRSGFYSIICTGSRQVLNAGMQGTPNMPIKCTIDVDLDQEWNKNHQTGTIGKSDNTGPDDNKCTPYDIALIMAGNHEGPIYADVDIKVKSGRIGRIVNGSLGALRDATYKYGGGTKKYPQNTFFGRANILLDPADSRFAKSLSNGKTTDDLVIVTELYNGGVGRALGSDGEINMPSISKNTVLMKGGTIGFPEKPSQGWTDQAWNNLINSDQIICGIYGGGAGGMNGIGYGDATEKSHVAYDAAHLNDEKYTALLPYWEDKTNGVFAYGDYATYITKTGDSHLTIKCYDADTKSYTYFDPLDASSEITIEGGKIGDKEKNIHASIFGAGSGFTSTQFLPDTKASYPNTRAGNVYGRSKDAVVATINIKGGTIYGNVYGAGKGTDYYYSTSRSSGTPANYTALGQTYGSVITNITGGTINGNIYGAGAGVAEAKLAKASTTYGQLTETAYLDGNATLNISGNAQIKSYDVTTGTGASTKTTTYGGNVYGGGMLAKVGGNTNINISGTALIEGDVFGAAQGITNKTASEKQTISGTTETYLLYTADNARIFGIVKGNTSLKVTNQENIGGVMTTTGTPTVEGNIYGGAESAITEGNTYVTINGGIINDIYGGGLGKVDGADIMASADIGGNTNVKVTMAEYYKDAEDSSNSDTNDHYIYGGGRWASIVGNVTNVEVSHGIAWDQTTVYGAGEGINTSCEMTSVRIKKFQKPSGLSYVYGGGNQGRVNTMTNVSVYGGQILRDVFGGGNMATVGTAVPEQGSKSDDEYKAVIKDWADNHGTFVSMENAKTKNSDNEETEEISDAIVYGDVYGGGNMADIYGNTSIKVVSGYFGGEIFGGGKGTLNSNNIAERSADIHGNTNIEVNGSIVIWNQKWDSSNKKFIEWNGSNTDTNFFTSYSEGTKTYPVFLNSHNIYGGGNKACKIGTYDSSGNILHNTGVSTVTVKKGFCDKTLLSTAVWKNAFDDNKNPHFYVFGGGYGAYTNVGTTYVNVGVKMSNDVETAETDQQLAKPRKTSSNEGMDNATIGVYDNSYGIPDYTVLGVVGGGYAGLVQDNSFVTFGGDTYTHRIFGGGYGQLLAYNGLSESTEIRNSKYRNNLGEVGGYTVVDVNGGYIYGDIFGGGAGVESTGSTGNYTDYVDMGRVHVGTAVTVSGTAKVYGNVYGGGDVANVGEAPSTSETDEAKAVRYATMPVSQSTFDGDGNITDYTAIDRHNTTSFVNIIGGDIYGQVFAGGNGRKKVEANDYTQLGRIEGNTLLHVANTVTEESSAQLDATTGKIVPYIWNRIYGGCSYGTVDGNTLVHIEGGMLGHNIFGGGYGDVAIDKTMINNGTASELDQVLGKKDDNATFANILGNTKVQIDGGSWIWNQYADENGNITTWKRAGVEVFKDINDFKSWIATVRNQESTAKQWQDFKDKMSLNDNDMLFFTATSPTNQSFRINHNIFGAGNRACYVGTWDGDNCTEGTGKSELIINHSPLTVLQNSKGEEISLQDSRTLAGFCWFSAINNTHHPQFSAFGAGYGVNTKVRETYVYAGPGVMLKSQSNLSNDERVMNNPSEGGKQRYAAQNEDVAATNSFEQSMFTEFNATTSDDLKKYYGSSDGLKYSDARTFLRFRASRLAWSFGCPNTIFMDIHGGGFSGYVTGDTKVVTDCQLTVRNVYGGGLGSRPIGSSITGTETFGEVGGNTTVDVKAGIVSNNVFGGGAGVESFSVNGVLTDFPDIARVKGKTDVTIWGEAISREDPDNRDTNGNALVYDMERVLVFGSVYGGGDVAVVGSSSTAADEITIDEADNVVTGVESAPKFATSVKVYGASTMSQAYAGGKGRTASECKDYTKVGAVYGNTRFYVREATEAYPYVEVNGEMPKYQKWNGSENVDSKVIPYLWNRVYGGCQNGKVYGNTLVDLTGGYFAYNIFGGGWGDVSDDGKITSADITGNTNIIIRGGEAKVTSLWSPEKRFWMPINTKDGKDYSPQYDPYTMKFTVNHNIYGGGNLACHVEGNTYIKMTKGMLHNNQEVRSAVQPDLNNNGFFGTDEWHEIYDKVGSPHFCVYGAGYGQMTNILGNTYIDVNLSNDNSDQTIIKAGTLDDKAYLYKHFISGQSVMDIVGGGYNGSVKGSTNVNVGGETFCRRVFGGGFYAPVGASNVNITSVDCNDIFGGGLMGDIGYSATAVSDHDSNVSNYQSGWEGNGKATVNIGSNDESNRNGSIWIHNNVYGGNDVSGAVKTLATLNINGGHILGNVHGAGNGDYLYALAKYGETKVTVNDQQQYDIDNDADNVQYPLVYSVPMRETMASPKSASDAQKIVNINSWRPVTLASALNIKGNSESDKVTIVGKVFGGGNSATVMTSEDALGTPSVTFNIGSHVDIGEVYMGSDGEAMFVKQKDNSFLQDFQDINGVNLESAVNWTTDPANHGISTTYLPTENAERPLVYPHLLDLYFQPVEMDVQATLKWADKEQGIDPGDELTDCTIGTFCCGGNRGNMNVYPSTTSGKEGSVVDYLFPSSLTITNKIVGGCNDANYIWHNSNTGNKIYHEGGYLLGTRGSAYPMIKLRVENEFKLKNADEAAYTKDELNVYGGCYNTGTIKGDILVDFRSDMLKALDPDKLKTANDLTSAPSMGSVYGAGYGMESYVYGDIKVLFGAKSATTPSKAKARKAASNFEANPSGSANFVYGGGQQGNVVGNTTVRIYNGHINKSVAGGSYAGYMWGSTQVLVGYPQYYTCQKSGVYNIRRADKWNSTQVGATHSALAGYRNYDESEVIKTTVYLMKGDIVSTEVFDAIKGYDTDHSSETPQATTGDGNNFSTVVTTAPGDANLVWNNIDIKIEEAVYGGGYSLAANSSIAAGTATVLKYTNDYNINDELPTIDPNGITESQGYGGNTTVLVWDNTNDRTNDHIGISSQVMTPVTLEEGADLFKLYYNEEGTYVYVYLEDTYHYTKGEDNASEKKYHNVYQSNSEGGLYGDGHLSFAEGFRCGEINGYGFSGSTPKNAKVINTFQRMDMLRVQDCSLALLGARDFTVNEVSTDPYSVARIGELQMVATKVELGDADALKPTTEKFSRNYLGFSNNIHYIGAISSNVPFTDTYRDHDGKPDASSTSYRNVKQHYIDVYKNNDAIFQKRNDGTAKNMIGISSGYALKLQNVYTTTDATTENFFYGPIVGVVEMNLINVREDEGGGYVYADNIHHRTSSTSTVTPENPYVNNLNVPSAHDATEDFLETSGNFVFPYEEKKHRYIVDDCFPTNFRKDPADNTQDKGIHYWYVTGYNYYYNARITGYTYDSGDNALVFTNSNKDGLMVLSGALSGQNVQLLNIKWRSNHEASDTFTACDLETTKKDSETIDKANGWGNNLTGDVTNNQYTYNHYNLGVYANSSYSDREAQWMNLPLNQTDATGINGTLKNALATDAPSLTFQLTDKADNGGNDYYQKYMQQPCQATLLFSVPAITRTTSGETTTDHPVLGYVPIQDFYTRDGSEGAYTYTKVTTSPIDKNSTTPYYYLDNDEQYKAIEIPNGKKLADMLMVYNESVDELVPVSGRAATTYTTDDIATVDGKNYDKSTLAGSGTTEDPYRVEFGAKEANVDDEKIAAVNATSITLGSAYTYYYEAARTYTYTVYLTIDYVQGPAVEGDITIQNCALPGEMIRLSTENLRITSDQTMLPNGYFWRIGPRKKSGDNWVFVDDSEWTPLETASGYDSYQMGSSTTPGVFVGRYEDKSANALDVPAYYYMNGYGVQYGFTVNGLPNIFPVPMTEKDAMLVHNYHQMDPHSNSQIDLHLKEALARAKAYEDNKTNVTEFARPRIYITDLTDLKAFAAFTDNGAIENKEYAEFFLQKDIDASSYIAPTETFKGTFHGDGHILKGITSSLFSSLADGANVYNLGLTTGVISVGDNRNNPTSNSKYHCCFLAPTSAGSASGSVVYRMDGSAVTAYTANDWHYGKVAYDLNQYYLESRYSRNTSHTSANNYVENYYANGDYQYAQRQNTNNGITYLRTGTTTNIPNYGSHDTRHDTNHTIDAARAVGYVAANGETPASKTGYQPLFNACCITDGAVADETLIQNDYIFFGQNLQATPDAYPSSINSHINDNATNRVWRASGFYGSKKDVGFHFNAVNHKSVHYDTYVHDIATTAVDFTCQHDEGTYNQDYSNNEFQYMFYVPASDLPTVYSALKIDEGVSQNLLVYTSVNNEETLNEAYDIANTALNYTSAMSESDIKGHHVVGSGDDFSTDLLHLVERTASDKNSEGGECLNNDFNCPIPFSVTERAWYTRVPLYYANATNTAWEGICLPFSVNKVTASYNGEITHFYGAENTTNGANNGNTTNVGHEYWLRGLTGVNNGKATFKRPGASLFTGGSLTGSYTYSNTHFRDVYGSYYESGNIYANPRTYSDYYFQHDHIPYIVSFPGKTFKEFDLSGEFNAQLATNAHNQWDANNDSHSFPNLETGTGNQTVTFEWVESERSGSSIVTIDGTHNTIPVTDDQTMTTVSSTAVHKATFASISNAAYGMNADGTSFDDECNSVLPFRTYMTASSTGNAKPRRILIAQDGTTEEIESDEDISESLDSPHLIVYPKGKSIIVESNYATTLKVYTVSGQIVRTLTISEGTNIFDHFESAIYIVGKTKLRIR